MSIEGDLAQATFLHQGGVYSRALMEKFKSGEMKPAYEYREYPKMLRINERYEMVDEPFETIKGVTGTKSVRKLVWDDEIVVNSDEEEDRVLSGGKTSIQIEEDRQALIRKCASAGIKVDPTWNAVRLRRELGEGVSASDPDNEMDDLKIRLARLEERAVMVARIAELEASLAAPAANPLRSDPDSEARAELAALGIKVDGRWSSARLQEELERATAGA